MRNVPTPRKVNSLAYCAQEVLAAAEEMKEAAVGASSSDQPKAKPAGFQAAEIVAFLRRNADLLLTAKLPERPGISGMAAARATAGTLRELASELEITAPRLEDLERRLTVLEEKLFAVLLAATPRRRDRCGARRGRSRIESLPPQDAGRADRSAAEAVSA